MYLLCFYRGSVVTKSLPNNGDKVKNAGAEGFEATLGRLFGDPGFANLINNQEFRRKNPGNKWRNGPKRSRSRNSSSTGERNKFRSGSSAGGGGGGGGGGGASSGGGGGGMSARCTAELNRCLANSSQEVCQSRLNRCVKETGVDGVSDVFNQ